MCRMCHILLFIQCQLQDCVPGDTPPDLCFLGDRKTPLVKVTERGEDESSLFIFSFSECSVMDLYRVTRPDVTEKETRATLSGLEEACNLYFQERFVNCCSVLHTVTDLRTNLCVRNWKKCSLWTFSLHEGMNTVANVRLHCNLFIKCKIIIQNYYYGIVTDHANTRQDNKPRAKIIMRIISASTPMACFTYGHICSMCFKIGMILAVNVCFLSFII